jgi:hypothetical protein
LILFYLCSKTKEMKVNLFGYSIELRRTTEFYNPVVHREGFYGFDLDGFGTRERLPFADGEMKSVLMMITNRMANAEWHAAVGDPTQEGGYELMVPIFVEQGDWIRIDTRSGEYADRIVGRK